MTHHATAARRARLGMRMALISVAVAAAGVGISAGVSLAHTPTVTPSCDGLAVKLASYSGPPSNNAVTVIIDGQVSTMTFQIGVERTFAWSSTSDHQWSVAIDANRIEGEPNQFDRNDLFGTQIACTPTSSSSTTSTTITSTPTTPPDAGSTTTTGPGATSSSAVPTTTPSGGVTTTTAPCATSPTTSTTPGGLAGQLAPVCAGTGPTPGAPAFGVEPPVPGAPSVSLTAPAGSTLPATGSNTGIELTMAIAVVLAGAGLVATARRRPHRTARNGGA